MSAKRTLHLVREPPGVSEAPAEVVAERDWVVYLRTMELAPRGEPPLAPGRIDHDQLVDLITRADRVITW
ncbi:MAG: hypothetical protein AB7T06_39300 [Kofleriaceae bacterium]